MDVDVAYVLSVRHSASQKPGFSDETRLAHEPKMVATACEPVGNAVPGVPRLLTDAERQGRRSLQLTCLRDSKHQ